MQCFSNVQSTILQVSPNPFLPSAPPQHLTTFLLDRKDGMITVEDGLRKLRLLDAKGKVWTQDMLLQVEEKAVCLIDQETQVGGGGGGPR